MAPRGALKYAAGAAITVGAVAMTPVLGPAVVGALGFGAGGISAGTWAAGLMSSYAGAVPAGSLCAVLQSVGAAGLSTSTIVGAEAAAASLATGFAAVGSFLFKKAPNTEDKNTPAPNKDNNENSEVLDKEPPQDAVDFLFPEVVFVDDMGCLHFVL